MSEAHGPGLVACIARGVRGRCPRCAKGRVFARFLKVAPACEACGLDLSQHRADDLPPYVVIFLVGHLVGALILETELRTEGLPLWLSMTVWPLVTLAFALALLQPAKGGVVGLQYALGMHGFAAARRSERDGPPDEAAEEHGRDGRSDDGRAGHGRDGRGADGAAHLGRA
jgi:uncharacterized protein (DUF983 family)